MLLTAVSEKPGQNFRDRTQKMDPVSSSSNLKRNLFLNPSDSGLANGGRLGQNNCAGGKAGGPVKMLIGVLWFGGGDYWIFIEDFSSADSAARGNWQLPLNILQI